MRTAEEKNLLAALYKNYPYIVLSARANIDLGVRLSKFFVSSTYTIPKKRVIGQPPKWRLIHNLSGQMSTNA